MKRNLQHLADREHDLLVIGGGIYGAAIARAAALQNLRVALIEQGDFGQATSANSLKIIHGGLRYLQHLDLKRMRESIRARRRLLQLAPHFVYPQAFIAPTYGHGLQGREIMAVALALNDIISWDRNGSVHPTKFIPSGCTLTRQECLHILPGVRQEGLTGAAQWYDCVVSNTERLTLSFILSAAELDACVANYVRAHEYVIEQDTVTGVKAIDCLTNDNFQIRARLTIDATGPWVHQLGHSLVDSASNALDLGWARAVNLVVRRSLFAKHAVGMASSVQHVDPDAVINKGGRYYFFIPWHKGTLIGTSYKPYTGSAQSCRIEPEDVNELVAEVNRIYPRAQLAMEDVSFFHVGLLPLARQATSRGNLNLLKHEQILDYAAVGRFKGLIAVSGVKYTTAVQVADKAIMLALRKLNRDSIALSSEPSLYGGEEVVTDVSSPQANYHGLSIQPNTLAHLKHQYGARYAVVLQYARRDPANVNTVSLEHETIVAEVVHAIREEMAQKLTDVVLRRTNLGTLAYPGDAAITRCAEIMACELGWDKLKRAREIDQVKQLYQLYPAERISSTGPD